MKKQVELTKDGYEALKRELNELVNVKRPKFVDRLANARSQGDLAENSDYANAKEDLEFLDGRIDELNEVLKNATVANSKHNGGIEVGTMVTLKAHSQTFVFEVVGEWEADPTKKKISPGSPLGRALVGRKVGEKVAVEAPAGIIEYQILAIK